MMDFARSPRVFSPIHHDLPFLLIRSHNNTEISITLTRNSYLTDQYGFNLDVIIAYHHIRLSSFAYHCLLSPIDGYVYPTIISYYTSLSFRNMRPWRCHTSPSHPTQVARPDRWDADMSSGTVDTHHSSTLTDAILRGGVGAQPITTPVAGQPPEEITLERALSDFLSCYYPSP